MDCLFCSIVAGDIPATVVYEDGAVVAFRDINPQAPVHVLVIPRNHRHTAAELEASDDELVGHLVRAAGKVAGQEGVAETGYRLIINAGSDAGETVPHLHVHVLGGRAMGWPPG